VIGVLDMTIEARTDADYFRYGFTAPLTVIDYDAFLYVVVHLPSKLLPELPFGPGKRLRIRGEVDGRPVASAFVPRRGKTPYLLLSRSFLKAIERQVGDEVTVRFNVDDPSTVDVPEELAVALRGDARAGRQWRTFSAGHQRGVCHRVRSAVREETRRARAKAIVAELARGGTGRGRPAKTRSPR